MASPAGVKAHKRYNKLMLRRINWAEDDDDDEGAQAAAMAEPPKQPNYCRLVWEGEVREAAFDKFYVQQSKSGATAKAYLAGRSVQHYWDLAAADAGA
jgi:U4/U6 small nuclear ribonucleoprotein PRP3